MAFPTIRCSGTAGTGSDSQASGAGPDTAIFGNNARTRNASSTVVCIIAAHGASPDMSGVAVDGSAVLSLEIATAGVVNHSRILGKQISTSTIDAGVAINSGSTDMTVFDSSFYVVGRWYRVIGAGAAGADFYSPVASLPNGTTVRFADTAGTTKASTTVEIPAQFTIDAATNTGGSNVNWSCGGWRLSAFSTSSRKYFNNSGNGDADAGWTWEYDDGAVDTHSGTHLSCGRSGNATSGPIRVRTKPAGGEGTAATNPAVISSNVVGGSSSTQSIFTVGGTNWVFEDLAFENTGATRALLHAPIVSSGGNNVFRRLKVANQSKPWGYGIVVNTDVRIEYCEFGYNSTTTGTSGAGIAYDGNAYFGGGHSAVMNYLRCFGNSIHHAQGPGVVIGGNTPVCPMIMFNDIWANGGDGVSLLYASTTALMRSPVVMFNTIDGNTGDGIEIIGAGTDLTAWLGLDVKNNLITNNGGYGVNCSGSGATAEVINCLRSMAFQGNNYHGNGSGRFFPTTNEANVNFGYTEYDPDYADRANGDFSLGNRSLVGAGFPAGNIGHYRTAPTYATAGGQQPALSSGGSGPARGRGR